MPEMQPLGAGGGLPLYGGGFFVAFLQLCTFYYSTAAILHFVLPRLLTLKSVQVHARSPGDVRRDALASIGG